MAAIWVATLFEFLLPISITQQLGNGELEAYLAAEALHCKLVRLPIRPIVAQHGQAEQCLIIQIINPVVVHEHALREVFVGLSLNFDVDEEPGFPAVLQPDLEQHVSEPGADFGFGHDAVQLFVEGFIATAPIDSFVDTGKKELEKGREIAEQSLFPGRVEIEPWSSFAHERNGSQRRARPCASLGERRPRK